MNVEIKKENWFYCDLCDSISYDFKCKCGASACNGAGCDECKDLHIIIDKMIDNKTCPTLEECKENNLIRWGEVNHYQNFIEKVLGK
jgi:hypothetical protein